MKQYTLDESEDELFGKRGTTQREAYEKEKQDELIREEQKKQKDIDRDLQELAKGFAHTEEDMQKFTDLMSGAVNKGIKSFQERLSDKLEKKDNEQDVSGKGHK